MSTVANPGTRKAQSRLAPCFVAFMVLSAAVMLLQSAIGTRQWHRGEFLGLLVAGAISSRLKVKFPGVNGSMSVNLPFIFIAMIQLSMGEALAVAVVSVFIQTIPKAPHKFVAIQALFNMSTAMVAAGLGWHAFQFGYVAHLNLAASLAWSCVVHLLASTVPVAVVISLMDSRRAFGTWSEIFHLSFPYYLASTGLASIAAAVGGHTNWPTLAGIACVMFVTYRSYRMYFNAMQNEPIEQTPQTAKAAAAGK